MADTEARYTRLVYLWELCVIAYLFFATKCEKRSLADSDRGIAGMRLQEKEVLSVN